MAKYHQWIDPKDPPINQTTNRAFQQTLNRSFVLCGQNLSRATRNFPPANQKSLKLVPTFWQQNAIGQKISLSFFLVVYKIDINLDLSWPRITTKKHPFSRSCFCLEIQEGFWFFCCEVPKGFWVTIRQPELNSSWGEILISTTIYSQFRWGRFSFLMG